MNDEYGYFGSGSSGYAHYRQTVHECFGGSGGSGGGGHRGADPDWGCLLQILKAGVLLTVPLYWLVTALYILTGDMAGIEPFVLFIDAAGTPAFGVVVYRMLRDTRKM